MEKEWSEDNKGKTKEFQQRIPRIDSQMDKSEDTFFDFGGFGRCARPPGDGGLLPLDVEDGLLCCLIRLVLHIKKISQRTLLVCVLQISLLKFAMEY